MKATLSRLFGTMREYPTKNISFRARAMKDVIDLSFGQPTFGPPDEVVRRDFAQILDTSHVVRSIKRYEGSLGSLSLRRAVSDYYQSRYNLAIDPETEILITNGGSEAVTLALLATTNCGDAIAVVDPSYVLYSSAIESLGRRVERLGRSPLGLGFESASADSPLHIDPDKTSAIIINSPENPSGYVLSVDDWNLIDSRFSMTGKWVIHDEVYDAFAFDRPHFPALCRISNRDNVILVNSFSKKFGVPGLRIGWLIGNPDFISLASKLHDYHYLGINIVNEEIGAALLKFAIESNWLDSIRDMLAENRTIVTNALSSRLGFRWDYKPMGAMFAFPNVSEVPFRSKRDRQTVSSGAGTEFANWALDTCRVALTPGVPYGKDYDGFVRLTTCVDAAELRNAMDRLIQSLA